MKLVLIVSRDPELRHAWDLVVSGIEVEILACRDLVWDAGRAYAGRAGPIVAKCMHAKWDARRTRQQYGPTARA
eukprot:7062949-Pyramimonas_sp.AAC.1